MYTETGRMFPYFQNFSPESQQFDDFCYSQKPNACLASLAQTSTISDYDLGGEGDLFKAPEPILEPPLITLDPMTSAISMISCGDNSVSPQELNVKDLESLRNEDFLSDMFYDWKDILSKESGMETSPLSEVLNFGFPVTTKENVHPTGQIPKSASSDSLRSIEWIHGAEIRPDFVRFTEMDMGNTNGMRRAFSDGDIKTLSHGNTSLGHPPLGQPQLFGDHTTECRWQKLSRYRNKKTKRNFGRKIKYACRKALADNQPRIRGRFAKTEETDILRK